MKLPRSIYRFWPGDRIEWLQRLIQDAKAKGLTLKVRNTGGRFTPMFWMFLWRGDRLIDYFFDIADAEAAIVAWRQP